MTESYVPLLFMMGLGLAFALVSVGASLIVGPKRYNRAKMEAYDRNGKMVKRFEVTKVQKIKGPDGREATALKEMKIETYNPFNGERKGRTYMTMDTPQQK